MSHNKEKISNIIKELNSEKNWLNSKLIARLLILNDNFDINLSNYELSRILDISEHEVNDLLSMNCDVTDYKKIISKIEIILNDFENNNELLALSELEKKIEQIKLIIGIKKFNKSILFELEQQIKNINKNQYISIKNILNDFYYFYFVPSYDDVQKVINSKRKYKNRTTITENEYNQFVFDSINYNDNNLHLKNIFTALKDIFQEYRDDFIKNNDVVKLINTELKSKLKGLM